MHICVCVFDLLEWTALLVDFQACLHPGCATRCPATTPRGVDNGQDEDYSQPEFSLDRLIVLFLANPKVSS